jgi:hypothetical protein
MSRIEDFFKTYESKIVLIIGFVLVAVIAFEGGYLQGKIQQESPMIIKDASSCPKIALSEASPAVLGENASASETSKNNLNLGTDKKDCMFVGSKNSNKYHLPTCRWAKNIKPENLVCFSSAEDAVAKGYQPDKTCIK